MNSALLFRQIITLYYALLAGQILFCLVAVFALDSPSPMQSGWPGEPLGMVLPILMAGGMMTAFLINNKRMASAAAEPDLDAKMAHYRTSVIIRSALLEGVNLFCIVGYLLEHNITFLYFFAAGILVFLYFRPSIKEFIQHYGISAAEQSQLGL